MRHAFLRPFGRVLAVLSLLVGLTAVALPASAAPLASSATTSSTLTSAVLSPMSVSQCPSANICVWSSSGYSGAYFGTPSYSTTNTGISTAYSYENTSSQAAYLYSGAWASGTATCIPPGQSVGFSYGVGAASIRLSVYTSC